MLYTNKNIKQVPVRAEADVVVAGGGVSGVVAAIAAARKGVNTILIERYGFLGGTATAALVAPMATFHNRRGEQIIRGIPQEIIEHLIDMGGAIGHVIDTIGVSGSITPYDSELLKITLQMLACKSRVRLFLHTWLADAVSDNSSIKEIVVVDKGGLGKIRGKVFVDATGDGDLAEKAGAPFEIGDGKDHRNCQPMSFIFKVGGVLVPEVINYTVTHREEFYQGTLFEELPKAPVIGLSGFFSIWKEGIAKQEVKVPRDRILLFTTMRPNEVIVNTTRVIGKSGIDPSLLTEAEIEGREQMLSLLGFLKRHVPGFQESYLLQSAAQIGVRETRRIKGKYQLTADDVIKGIKFEDGIAKGAWPVDIHDPKGKGIIMQHIDNEDSYDIPYGCLCPISIRNILVAGRCISATHEAFASSRVMPTSMAVGQAAGTAAAMAATCGLDVSKIDIKELRKALEDERAIV